MVLLESHALPGDWAAESPPARKRARPKGKAWAALAKLKGVRKKIGEKRPQANPESQPAHGASVGRIQEYIQARARLAAGQREAHPAADGPQADGDAQVDADPIGDDNIHCFDDENNRLDDGNGAADEEGPSDDEEAAEVLGLNRPPSPPPAQGAPPPPPAEIDQEDIEEELFGGLFFENEGPSHASSSGSLGRSMR